MRWYESATCSAGAAQMLTIPVASVRDSVASRMGSANFSSAAGDMPTQTAP